ncbi:unnamed protein product [Protopolystoma xenopodis]|uniref:Uncharacterized protein n=1 Tax=Protopolystoma xenopodis TaxID=117903 RepID=A0A3S5BVN5_9PLAT|nr:unnamed protein product [Protopolystoma xenopodis]
MDESSSPFPRNRRRLPRKQRQHECCSKANRQLVKKNPPSSSAGTELRISSRNTFTRNGSKLKSYYYSGQSGLRLSSLPSGTRTTFEAKVKESLKTSGDLFIKTSPLKLDVALSQVDVSLKTRFSSHCMGNSALRTRGDELLCREFDPNDLTCQSISP